MKLGCGPGMSSGEVGGQPASEDSDSRPACSRMELLLHHQTREGMGMGMPLLSGISDLWFVISPSDALKITA